MLAYWIIFIALLLFVPLSFCCFDVIYIKKYNLDEKQQENLHFVIL